MLQNDGEQATAHGHALDDSVPQATIFGILVQNFEDEMMTAELLASDLVNITKAFEIPVVQRAIQEVILHDAAVLMGVLQTRKAPRIVLDGEPADRVVVPIGAVLSSVFQAFRKAVACRVSARVFVPRRITNFARVTQAIDIFCKESQNSVIFGEFQVVLFAVCQQMHDFHVIWNICVVIASGRG